MSVIVEKVQAIIEAIVVDQGCELVDIEYVKEGKNWFLRVYADRPGGIDLDDCASISEEVSVALDKIQPDPFPDAYFLEISSPGAEKPLKTEAQIQAALGEYVHFDYYVAQHGEKFHEGYLKEIQEDAYVLEVQIKNITKTLTIDKSAVAKARLALKF